MSASRRAALHVLDAALGRQVPLDRAFDRAAQALEGPDRAFARALAATTLRRLGQIDAVLAPFLKRPLPKKALTARNLLRLGAAQLLFLETPPHAAVGETTGLATGRVENYRGLINAVLRRVADGGPRLLDGQDAARLNTPGWLWEAWAKAYGRDTARAIAEAHGAEAPLDVTVFADAPVEWAAALEGDALSNGTVRRPGPGRVEMLPGYGDGAWAPQDAAAAMIAPLLGNVSGVAAIDLCAAPGGKTAQLAAAGADVTAVDQNENRLERLSGNLERLGLKATVITADALEWRPAEAAPAVLLDVPCSATGTIRRHPDLPWAKTSKDVKALLPLQAALLDAAAEMTAPGGRLVYACCSLQPEEGPRQIERFLKRNPAFARAALTAADAPGLPEAITAEGDFRTLPSMWAEIGGMDGFYAARLVKTAQ